MAAKRQDYREGDWFAVPLRDGYGGYAIGKIARMGKKRGTFLGYFFGPRIYEFPDSNQLEDRKFEDATIIANCSDAGLENSEWTVLVRPAIWNRKAWPMVLFGQVTPGYDEYPDIGYVSQYDEDDLFNCLARWRVSPEEAMKYPKNRFSGDVAMVHHLEQLLPVAPAADEQAPPSRRE